jgi:DnaK suppressor protein
MTQGEKGPTALSARELAWFKKALKEDQRIAIEELASSTSEVHDLLEKCADKVPDPADKLEPPYKENRVLGGRSLKLENIHKALMRIDAKSYGICAECGALIDKKRLKATRTVRTCVSCQSGNEEEEARNKKLMCCRGTIGGKHG